MAIIVNDPAQPFLAYDLFGVISSMDAGTPEMYVEEMLRNRWDERLDAVLRVDHGPTQTSGTIFSTPTKHVIVLAGVRRTQHVANVMTNVMLQQMQRTDVGMCPFWANLASEAILGAMENVVPVGDRQSIILGHSYGSGIGTFLNLKMRARGLGRDHRLVLVGPPRVLSSNQLGMFDRANTALYQNRNDPVCTIMPHSDEAGPLLPLYSAGARALADELHCPTFSTQITQATGERTDIDGQSDAGDAPIAGVLMWAFTLDRFLHPTHSRPAYADSLNQMYLRYNAAAPRQFAPSSVASGEGYGISGSWGAPDAPTPAVNVVQGMEVVAAPPADAARVEVRSGPTRTRRRLVIVEGVVVGRSRTGTQRRRVVQAAKRLKRLCGKLVEFNPQALAGVVSKWPARPQN